MLKNLINNKKIEYVDLLNKINFSKFLPLEGRLNVSRNGRIYQYYLVRRNSNMVEKIYLNKNNRHLAIELAQKEYFEKVEKLLRKRIRQFSKFLDNYEDDELESIYKNLHPARKVLVEPILNKYQQKLKEWKSQTYEPKKFFSKNLEIYSKKGERVRSKSEKILADIFNDLNIDYKYECPLRFKNGRVLYPDFTFLNMEGNKVYWEHHGLMDDKKYIKSFIKKLSFYEKNGINRRENLIVTYESSQENLDYNWVIELIDLYKLR